MGSRTLNRPRCSVCGLQEHICMCSLFVPFETRTRVAMVFHFRELRKFTNTGRIALLCLKNSVSFVRGLPDESPNLSELDDPTRRHLLLFPRDDARVLSKELLAEDPRPVTLIVPDGTWGQARRAVKREPQLVNAEAVLPPPAGPSRYRLRREHDPEGLGTIEAIARAMGVLEGTEVQARIEALFDEFVERTLETRQPTGRRPWE